MQNRIEKQFEGFIKTPPLWKNSLEGIAQFKLPEVKNHLETSVAKDSPSLASNFVMGKRVERFFEWIIRQDNNFELLAENIQISCDKITKGEIDFLLKDLIKQQFLHIEMVYKFYVYDPSFSSEMGRWIGPNRRDSLLQKITKLKEKQFPLLFKPETEDLLNSLNLNSSKISQKTCFKANLFVPKHLENAKFPQVNKDSIVGTWLYFADFKSNVYKDFEFFAPKKQDWPILPNHGETWYTHSEIIIQIENLFEKKKAPLIWMKKPGNNYERFFVVWW